MHRFRTHSFKSLTPERLHDILRLRCEVFIVEQAAPYADIDGLDPEAVHLCMLKSDKLIGYTRILAPGIKFPEATMGRIVLSPEYRGKSLGRTLITQALVEINTRFPNAPICIEAREDLQPLYKTMGFNPASEPYDWAGIMYVKMLRAAA